MNRLAAFFNNLGLKWKFTAISMVISLSAIVVSTTLFITVDYFDTRAEFVGDALIEAEITGQACSAALLFGDAATAKEILGATKSNANILRATILDAKGRDFAEYRRAGEKPAAGRFGPSPEGWRFEGDMLTLKKPVVVDQKTVGSIYMEKSLRGFYHHEMVMAALMLAIVLLSFPVALWLSLRLQSVFTGPIQGLAGAANRVSETRDYSVRASGGGADEMGTLIKVFNEMLGQIEERDARLKFHAAELESQVAYKTEEHRKAREEAENATKLKDKFMAAASHDLRSPIASLQVLVRYMQGLPKIEADPETKKVFAAAFKNTQGILKLIDALLDLNRIQMGKFTYRFEECNADGIVAAAIQPLQALADAKNIAIHNSLRPGLAITVDEALFVQAIQNLISNAIKYCECGDEISITGEMTPHGFVLAVKDTGTGIPPEKLARLFAGDIIKSTPGTAGESGSGLGLQFCREIIKAHGGRITVESKVAEGTAFSITLPPPEPPAKAE